MKFTRALLVVLCLSVLAYAQQAKPATVAEDKQQSNIEKFLAKSGSLLEKTFVDIGVLKGGRESVKVKVMKITDVLTKASLTGVRFEKETGSGLSLRTSVAFLDPDEVDALISSVNYCKGLVGTSRPSYTEVEYSSRGGFKAGCFTERSGGGWQSFIQISRYDGSSSTFFETAALDQMVDILKQAKLQLK